MNIQLLNAHKTPDSVSFVDDVITGLKIGEMLQIPALIFFLFSSFPRFPHAENITVTDIADLLLRKIHAGG